MRGLDESCSGVFVILLGKLTESESNTMANQLVSQRSTHTNQTKRFTLTTQPALYSKYGLVKYRGAVGVFPRTRTEVLASPAELDAPIFETARRRLALGYSITACKGPDRCSGRIASAPPFCESSAKVSTAVRQTRDTPQFLRSDR